MRLWVDICPRIPDYRTYQETIKHFIVRFGDGGSEKLKWAPVSNKGLEIIQDRGSNSTNIKNPIHNSWVTKKLNHMFIEILSDQCSVDQKNFPGQWIFGQNFPNAITVTVTHSSLVYLFMIKMRKVRHDKRLIKDDKALWLNYTFAHR